MGESDTGADRLYLDVPPEDEGAAKALGAQRDDKSRRWYIGSGEEREDFARWLPEDDPAEDREFTITSDHAYVAAATVPCQSCGTLIEVMHLLRRKRLKNRVPSACSSASEAMVARCRFRTFLAGLHGLETLNPTPQGLAASALVRAPPRFP